MERITDSTHFTTSNKSASKKHHNIVTYNDLFKTPILYKEFDDRVEFTRAGLNDYKTTKPSIMKKGFGCTFNLTLYDHIIVLGSYNFEQVDEDTLIYYF